MARRTQSGNRGFTLIELMIVMTVISILMSVAVPMYSKALTRSKETILRQNLTTMRTVIDVYTYDKGKAPQTLDDLVQAGYLRKIPIDPISGSQEWRTIMEDASNSVNQSEPGIFDVRSTTDKMSLEGTPYTEW
jgi:general secretion pathway protein G